MRGLIRELAGRVRRSWFWGLRPVHKVIVSYFVLSFCLVCGVVAAEWWQLALVVANFALASRLVRLVPVPDDEEDEA